jgi:hypothetical protein
MSTEQNKKSDLKQYQHEIEHKSLKDYPEDEDLMQGLQRVNSMGELEEYYDGYWHSTEKGLK